MGKTIFVMGDDAADLVLVPQNKYVDVNRKSNYDLFTRDLITSHWSQSGCVTLYGLLRQNGGFEVYKSGNSKISLETISEWKFAKERLYLTNHIGLIKEGLVDEVVPLAEQDLLQLQKSEIVAIYNMSSTIYCTKKQLQSIDKAATILLRTKFEDDRQPSSFLKMLGDTPLRRQTVLLFNVNELRRAGFNINKGVSWEQLLIETIGGIKDIPHCDEYMYIIVCFNHEGCLVYSKGTSRLVFYPGEIEGDYVTREDKRVFGPIICMQAYLAQRLAIKDEPLASPAADYVVEAVACGLAAMRALIKLGYNENAEYPTEDIAELMGKDPEKDLPVSIDLPARLDDDYTIIGKAHNNMLAISRDIVRRGCSALKVPFLRYDKLLTYDRFEIEQFRNIRNLFSTYMSNDNISRPLSICVFGPPGSGKSFAVRQIANSIDHGKHTTVLKFNLSQMVSQNDLSSAFHQIRDEGLKGKLPIAFFDEFDSMHDGGLGWLKYFLAPMQDGEFRDSATTHFIGRGIFVFAGGTCVTLKEFKSKAEEKNGTESKVNDFLSRIHGYIDIYGPNKKKCPNYVHGKSPEECRKHAETIRLNLDEALRHPAKKIALDHKAIADCPDKYKYCYDTAYYLRRATLLRGVLERKLGRKDGNEIEIDDKLLDAFLLVDEYLHGARSLEAIVQMSELSPGYKYSVSCINRNGLELYVGDSFKEYLDGQGTADNPAG